jgi:hypothetical protein
MVDFDIDRAMDEPDYQCLRIAANVGSAGDNQRIIEEYLPLIRDQMTVRFRTRMARDYPDLSEAYLQANSVMATVGIEPPTRGFSVRHFNPCILRNQSLAALATPHSSLIQSHFRHTQSRLVT